MWSYTHIDELYHHGIKGQKWGVRRYQNLDGSLTEKGKKRYSVIGASNRISIVEKKSKKPSDSLDYRVYDTHGKKVGNVFIDLKDDDYHIDWIGIKNKEQRKGYGQEALQLLVNDAIKRGKKHMSLDAAGIDPAGIDPAARHIYEKVGFKSVETIKDEFWDDLIIMKKDL